MKKTPLAVAAIAGLVSSLALLAPRAPEVAAQDSPQPPPRPGGTEEGMMRRPFAAMMAGGPGSMVALDKHLYVLMGPTLYKIDPEKMEVVKKLDLVQPADPRRPNAGPGAGPGTAPGAAPDAGRPVR